MKTAIKQSKPVLLGHKLKADAKGAFPTEMWVTTIGEWKTPWHNDFDITIDDLEEAIQHFDNGVYRVNGTEPLPITLDHLGGGSPAAGRIHRVYRIEDSLFASVEWTKLGEEKLERDEYRYVSFEFNPRSMPFENPEKEGEWLNNVLTGATLTNDPLFKKQKLLMASARSGDNQVTEGDKMNLAELLAKKQEDLTQEEKAFIAEHKDELTDEQRTTYGLNEETAEEKEAREKAEKEAADAKAAEEAAAKEAEEKAAAEKLEASAKSMTADRLKKLEADAKAGREAQQELLKTRLTASVKAHVDRGAVKSEELESTVEMLMASSEKQRERIESFMKGLPTNPLIASAEKGKGGGDDDEEQAVVLTDDEKELADVFGNTPEDLEAFKKAQAEK